MLERCSCVELSLKALLLIIYIKLKIVVYKLGNLRLKIFFNATSHPYVNFHKRFIALTTLKIIYFGNFSIHLSYIVLELLPDTGEALLNL